MNFDEYLPQRSREGVKIRQEKFKMFMIPIERQILHPANR